MLQFYQKYHDAGFSPAYILQYFAPQACCAVVSILANLSLVCVTVKCRFPFALNGIYLICARYPWKMSSLILRFLNFFNDHIPGSDHRWTAHLAFSSPLSHFPHFSTLRPTFSTLSLWPYPEKMWSHIPHAFR
jgi:hypothetical protein